MKRFPVLVALLAVVLLAPLAHAQGQAALTPEETAWLKAHGPVKVAVFHSYPPIAFTDSKGRAQGVAVDYWKLLAQKAGFQVRFTATTMKAQLDGLSKGRYDSLGGIFPLSSREREFSFTRPWLEVNSFIYVQSKFAGQVKGLKDLVGLKVGVVKGDSTEALCEKNGVKTQSFSSYSGTVLALAQKKLDAIVMDEPVAAYMIERRKLGASVIRVDPAVDFGTLALPVRRDEALLGSILGKATAAVSKMELEAIIGRWKK